MSLPAFLSTLCETFNVDPSKVHIVLDNAVLSPRSRRKATVLLVAADPHARACRWSSLQRQHSAPSLRTQESPKINSSFLTKVSSDPSIMTFPERALSPVPTQHHALKSNTMSKSILETTSTSSRKNATWDTRTANNHGSTTDTRSPPVVPLRRSSLTRSDALSSAILEAQSSIHKINQNIINKETGKAAIGGDKVSSKSKSQLNPREEQIQLTTILRQDVVDRNNSSTVTYKQISKSYMLATTKLSSRRDRVDRSTRNLPIHDLPFGIDP